MMSCVAMIQQVTAILFVSGGQAVLSRDPQTPGRCSPARRQMKSEESHCNHGLASDVADEVRRVSLHSRAGK